MPIQFSLAPFLLTSLLIELTPGPNMAFLALVSATKGRRFGFATVAGIGIGLLLIGLLAALGVTKLVSASPLLFELMRWAGILYMVYLAWYTWREDTENSPVAHQSSTVTRYFRHGLIINLLNPKAGLFFIAILPTFLSSTPAMWEAPVLTLIYVAVATIIHFLIVIFCSPFHTFLSAPSRSRVFRKTLSLALVAVAAWMLWATRNGL